MLGRTSNTGFVFAKRTSPYVGPAAQPQGKRPSPPFPLNPFPRKQEVTGTESIAVDVEAYQGSEAGFSELGGSHWISIAAANVLPKMALYQALRLLKSYQLDTVRCHLDVVDDPGNGSVTMVSAGGVFLDVTRINATFSRTRNVTFLSVFFLQRCL